jgi:hypothetical protein
MAITVLTPAIAEASTFSARLVEEDSSNDKLDLQNVTCRQMSDSMP